jgi:hypothetical protein
MIIMKKINRETMSNAWSMMKDKVGEGLLSAKMYFTGKNLYISTDGNGYMLKATEEEFSRFKENDGKSGTIGEHYHMILQVFDRHPVDELPQIWKPIYAVKVRGKGTIFCATPITVFDNYFKGRGVEAGAVLMPMGDIGYDDVEEADVASMKALIEYREELKVGAAV